METPLSPNWPATWISTFTFLLSPVKAFILPRVPEAWRFTAAALVCYAFTIVAAWRTPLTGPEVYVQGGVLLGLVYAGYAAARSSQGAAIGLGAAAVGTGAAAGIGLILPAFAQEPSVGEAAKEAARSQIAWWLAWGFSVLGGWIGRKLDGRPATIPSPRKKT